MLHYIQLVIPTSSTSLNQKDDRFDGLCSTPLLGNGMPKIPTTK